MLGNVRVFTSSSFVDGEYPRAKTCCLVRGTPRKGGESLLTILDRDSAGVKILR